MSDASQTTYVDQNGNIFHNFGINGTVTLAGSNFKDVIPVATLAVSVVWLTCFTVLLVMLIKIRWGAPTDSKVKKFLRWPVIGLSIFSMVVAFAIDVYNRIIHEKRETKKWWILVITIPQDVFIGLAHGTLIAFLLWQFTPALLFYGNVSKRRSKHTVFFYKFLTFFITVADTADKVISAVLYVLKMLHVLNGVANKQDSNDEKEVSRFSNLGETVSNAVFQGLYLICIVAFAVVAWIALKRLHKSNALDKHFRWSLALLTVCLVLRSLLDLIWSLVFKLGALYINHTIGETQRTTLIDNALYGFFSVLIYLSILRIASLPDSEEYPLSQVQYHILGAKNPDNLKGSAAQTAAWEQYYRREEMKNTHAQATEFQYQAPPMQGMYGKQGFQQQTRYDGPWQ